MVRTALLALGVALVVSATAWAADVTGKWVGSVESPQGPIELTYDLKMDGEVVTGTITSAMGSVAIDKGRLSGDLLTYEVSLQGAVVKHEARLDAAATTIAVKATGDWGTVEYSVKKVAAAQ